MFREVSASYLFFNAQRDPIIRWRSREFKLKWGGEAESVEKATGEKTKLSLASPASMSLPPSPSLQTSQCPSRGEAKDVKSDTAVAMAVAAAADNSAKQEARL